MSLKSLRIKAAQWWRAKSNRDQGILAAAMVLLLAVTWYQFAWSPLDGARRAARGEVQRLGEASQMLARLPSNAAGAAREPGSLQALITGRAAAEGLVASAVETPGSNLVVSFDTVPFDPLARWLDSVGGMAGVRIEAARIERRPEPGTVSADIELSLP